MNKQITVAAMILALILIPAWVSSTVRGSDETYRSQTPEALVERMGDDDFRVRDEAFEALRALGETAADAIRKGVDSDDPEIRWRSKRLLRMIEERRVPAEVLEPEGAAPMMPGIPDDADRTPRAPHPFDRFDRFFGDDRGFGRTHPFGSGPLIDLLGKDHQQMMEELQQRYADIMKHFDSPLFEFDSPLFEQDLPMRGQSVQSSSSSMNITIRSDDETIEFRSDDDGTSASVTRTEDGIEKTETFEADDLEGFKKSYPELSEKLGLDRLATGTFAGRSFRFDRGGAGAPSSPFGRLPFARGSGSPDRLPGAPLTGPLTGPSKKRLGILCADVPPVLRAHMDIAEDRGILVEEVESGSLAERIGMKVYDIVVSINGSIVGRPEDIRAALAAIDSGADVEIDVIRSGKAMTLKGALGRVR